MTTPATMDRLLDRLRDKIEDADDDARCSEATLAKVGLDKADPIAVRGTGYDLGYADALKELWREITGDEYAPIQQS